MKHEQERPAVQPEQMNEDLLQILHVRKLPSGRSPLGGGKGRKKKKTRKSKGFWVLIVLAAVLLALVLTVVFTILVGRSRLTTSIPMDDVEVTAPKDAVVEEGGEKVVYDGRTWRKNPNVINVLCMGIDRDKVKDSGNRIGENGQADTLFVAAINTKTKEVNMINISRDAMVDVDLYNVNGEYAGTERTQICLAYAYGDGAHSSCLNEAKAVSRFLYGMQIDAYASIDLPAIPVLTDLVGGVEVNVLSDLSDQDPSLVKGARVLLRGELVETYIRSRDFYDLEANSARMERQQQFLTAFIGKVKESVRNKPTFLLTLYEATDPYMTTDIGFSEFSYLAMYALRGGFDARSIHTVPGEIRKGTDAHGEEHAEFYADEEALYRLILETYYIPEG